MPNYIVFNRVNDQLRVVQLVEGHYQGQDVSGGRFWLADWAIGLEIWQGEYQGCPRSWLRWYGPDGRWVPAEVEDERHRRQASERMAKQERSQADRLADKLRALGIDPDEV